MMPLSQPPVPNEWCTLWLVGQGTSLFPQWWLLPLVLVALQQARKYSSYGNYLLNAASILAWANHDDLQVGTFPTPDSSHFYLWYSTTSQEIPFLTHLAVKSNKYLFTFPPKFSTVFILVCEFLRFGKRKLLQALLGPRAMPLHSHFWAPHHFLV